MMKHVARSLKLSQKIFWCLKSSLGISAIALSAIALSPTQSYAQDVRETVFHCASSQGRRAVCEAGGFIQAARIERKVSASPCDQGKSWGIEGTTIWVDRGCRADFRVSTIDVQIPFQIVNCASSRMKRSVCPVQDMFITDISLVRQDSNSPCQLGKSYGFSEHEIWVDKGCRGAFKVYGVSGFPPIGGPIDLDEHDFADSEDLL